MTKVNDGQVGGKHYKSKFQHWDWAELYGLGAMEYAATKYVTRWRNKHENGIVDLRKIVHYVEKLIELHVENGRLPRGHTPVLVTKMFSEANNLEPLETRFCIAMSTWSSEKDLEFALGIAKLIIEAAEVQYARAS